MVKKRVKFALLCIALLMFGAAVIIFPERYVTACFQGFAMWAECVLPSLFPFMIITLIAVKTGIAEKASLPLKKMTGVLKMPSAAPSCFILSICSGYPAGSRIVSEFYQNGALTKDGAQKLSYLCSTSGPLFIIGSVGFKMFGNKLTGIKILIAHVLAVTLISVIICLFSKKSNPLPQKRQVSKGNLLYDCFYGAVISVAVAGAFIAFFYVVAKFCQDFSVMYPLEALLKLFLDEKTASAVCLGLVEVTTGCRALAPCSDKLSVAFAGFLITFGGVSIILQQLGFLSSAGVKPLKFIGVKFIQALVCFCILLIIA